MSLDGSPFIKHFNPCADRVEDIDHLFSGSLNDKSLLRLLDHIEKCKRCRRYHYFLDSVDHGFNSFSINQHDFKPFDSCELPVTLQTDIIESMIINFSKWLFEYTRTTMYNHNTFSKFFMDLLHPPLNRIETYNNSNNIANYLLSSDLIDKETGSNIQNALILLNSPSDISSSKFTSNLINILELCLSFNHYDFLPYIFYDQILRSCNELSKASNLNIRAIQNNPPPELECLFLSNLGSISVSKKSYNKSLEYYKDSIKKHDLLTSHLNMGIVFLELNILDKSVVHFHQAFNVSDKPFSLALRLKQNKFCIDFLQHHYNLFKSRIDTCSELLNIFTKMEIH